MLADSRCWGISANNQLSSPIEKVRHQVATWAFHPRYNTSVEDLGTVFTTLTLSDLDGPRISYIDSVFYDKILPVPFI